MANPVTADTDATVVLLLRKEGVPLLPTEVALWTGLPRGAVRRSLARLQTQGLVERNDNGYYGLLGGDGDR